MNRIFSLLIGIIFIIGVAGFAFYFTPNTPVASEKVQPSTETYLDTAHRYAVTYPADLDVLTYTDDLVSIGHLIEGGIAGVADVRVIDVEGRAGESLTEAAARELETLCDADGPTGSFSCSGIESTQPFTTTSGIQGTVLYLQGEMRELPSGTVTAVAQGPYYVFPMRSSAVGSRVIVIHPPLNVHADGADADTIRTIALSLTLIPE